MTVAAPARRWRRIGWRLLTVGFLLAVCVAVGTALANQDWSVVAEVLRERRGGHIAALLTGAVLAAAGGLALGILSWRVVLLDLGPPVSPVRVVRVFCLGFLAKFVPGKVPGMLATLKIAQVNGVTLGRMISVGVLSQILTILSGLAIGLLAGVEVLGASVWWLALALVPTAVVLLRPDLVFNRTARWALRLLRRPPPAAAASARGVRRAVGAQCLAWLVAGLHLWLLAVAMGAPPLRSLLLCVGAFSLATAIGMLAFVAPDGIGVREVVLMAALVTVLPVPAAAVVVLASRLVTTVSEITLAVSVLAVAELRHRHATRRGPDPGGGEPAEAAGQLTGDRR